MWVRKPARTNTRASVVSPRLATAQPHVNSCSRRARLRRLIDAGRTLIAKLDVEAVLQQLLNVARELTGARYAAVGVLDGSREPERHTSELESTAYRLVQEALTNAVRHAGASKIRIDVTERNGCVEIAVADDGQGFDLAEKPKGFGLTGMRERVELAGGGLDIDSGPTGTTIRAKLPVQRREAGSRV
jgi:signal transduction histidine kinase